MVVTRRDNYRGRKQKPLSYVWTDSGRMAVFLGYCPDTNCHGKILIDLDEAKALGRRFSSSVKPSLFKSMVIRLARRWAAV